MPITVARANLLSNQIRQRLNNAGITRVLNLSPKLQSNQEDGSAQPGGILGFLRFLIPFAKRLGGFLSGILKGISLTVSSVFGLVVDTVTTLANFDWNASDREIAAMIRANNISLASTWGGAIGSGLGWIAGIAVGYGLTVLCPVIGSAKLAKLAAGETSLEAAQEVGATAINALRASARNLGANLLLASYRKVRKWFGINPPDDAPSWTIAGKIEERIDNIKSDIFRAFIESLTDEFFDSFVESGYIFAYELDAQIAAARAAQSRGVERTVVLTPDKEAKEEKIVLVGPEAELKTTVQTALVQHRLIHNRDIGLLVGQPAQDWFRAQTQRRQLVILFYDREKPPWRHPNGKIARSATYTIPDCKANLKWEEIKRAAKSYMWGRFRATANLSNGRQMAVYGATREVAEEKLRDLIALSTARISTLSITEERDRNPQIKKDPRRMYPAFATVLVRRPTTDATGRATASGDMFEERKTRFALWTDKEPDNFKEVRW
ncbi:hypothetical protein HJG54_19640 [Leptolyngbya sp. NK1-12]|uniref:Uncharacterized protein n=1 Tax=Leptolyngbya sp. NK1-12 TaxID=2547451 RepID=A0AA97AJF1_9CYAN|nr:hypothetical protein [Leptolyngbya sp. NK1-12]WNZ24841.1 hypothetical protein HJG54_19640 [Leptolyngbya sp. NK1-12]